MNCLEIIQQACLTLGFSAPRSINNTQDYTILRLLGLLNRSLEQILMDYQWQKMVKFCQFSADKQTAYNSVLDGYNLELIAPGFKSFITDYIYNETQQKTINSITYDKYIAYRINMTSSSISENFILQNNHILFMPHPSLYSKISFFYKSKSGVYNFDEENNLLIKEYFTQDSDKSEIESHLLLLGLIFKYKNEMGFDYAESFREYQNCLEIEKSIDSNARRIKEAANTSGKVIANIPDNNIGY
ncbi:MAG: hypothetical protein LBD46_07810 [Endomicrobium sp.]|jgi:hypothetical protein|nr:hypothetical protein [Endomicrobium sp.]